MAKQHLPWIAYLRISLGLFWLLEITLGQLWKIGLTHGPHAGWLARDEQSASTLHAIAQRTLEQSPHPWLASLIEQIILPYEWTLSIAIVALSIALAVSLILGLLVRPISLLGLIMCALLIQLGQSTLYPYYAMGLIFTLLCGAGSASLDTWLLGKLHQTTSLLGKLVRAIVRFAILPRFAITMLGGAAVLAGLYLWIILPQLDAQRPTIANMELAALLLLGGLGALAVRAGIDHWQAGAEIVRVFVGFKLIQEIFVRDTLAANALPGWASAETWRATLEPIAAAHWAPLAHAIDTAVLPYLDAWAIAFAIAQTLIGIMLLLGWRCRLAAALGLLMCLLLVVMGFVGLTPLLLIFLPMLLGIGCGRMLAIDAIDPRSVRNAWAVRWWVTAPAALGAIALFIAPFALDMPVVEMAAHQREPDPPALLDHDLPDQALASYAALSLGILLLSLALVGTFRGALRDSHPATHREPYDPATAVWQGSQRHEPHPEPIDMDDSRPANH